MEWLMWPVGRAKARRQRRAALEQALLMIGVAPANRVLVVGAGDGQLAAALARVTGLNGRTLVIEPDPAAQARVESAAAEAGTLVEVATDRPAEPVANEPFQIVVCERIPTDAPAAIAPALTDACTVLRPGGRLLVIEELSTPNALGLRVKRPDAAATLAAVQTALTAAGLERVRVLGEIEGIAYLEGLKPRPR
jgi:protein-L-isoaspartate O-methyltransferase